MPPRKRAASAPKADPEQEPLASESEDGDEQAEAATDDSPEQAPDGSDGAQKPDDGDVTPERSDLQTADLPCQECMPNGWPEGAFSVGCTHGTYVRKQD